MRRLREWQGEKESVRRILTCHVNGIDLRFTSASKKKTSLKIVFQVGGLEGILEPSTETSLLNAAMAASCVVVGGDDDSSASAQ